MLQIDRPLLLLLLLLPLLVRSLLPAYAARRQAKAGRATEEER